MLPPELQCLQILIVYENGYSLNESYSDFKQLSRFFGSFLILTALYLVLLERRGHLHSKVFVVLVKSSKTLSITLTSSVLKLSKLEKKTKAKSFFYFGTNVWPNIAFVSNLLNKILCLHSAAFLILPLLLNYINAFRRSLS